MTDQTLASPEISLIVNDITGLNPVAVRQIIRPTRIEEISAAIAQSSGPVSIGGGRFSMGGQTASPDSLHLDMRGMNKVLEFSPERRIIRVEAGIRWCDIQQVIDPHGLAIKIMQTYANFTVGGALSVNCHGRYIGLGPVILSVRRITLVLADSSVVRASPSENTSLFYGAIGGYGGLGVIVEAELDLVANSRVARSAEKMQTSDYPAYFRRHVRDDKRVVFHNGDIYPPHYETVRAVSWCETDAPITHQRKLQTHPLSLAISRYVMWVISELPSGKWRREYIYEPLVYARQRVHWRNHEASYDVAELEPRSRRKTTYVLQEYFVPVEKFDVFAAELRRILRAHRVNMINISIRHALPDPGSLLAWARTECFAFVLYYKQGTDDAAKTQVGIWTRALIDAVIAVDGSYYLPYQPYASPEQFHAAYPRAREYFALKQRLDPGFRFRNALWDKYYPASAMPPAPVGKRGDFQTIYSQDRWRDAFYAFLQHVFHLFPEHRLHALITEICASHSTDDAIYQALQGRMKEIKPPLADIAYGVPALLKQKREMAAQSRTLLGEHASIDGYVEIGSTGRYVRPLRRHLAMTGPTFIINDIAPGMSPPDIIERGQIQKLGTFIPLNDYTPISRQDIADESVDLVSCYIGLHHCPPDRLDGFLKSIHRILRPGGRFLLRDHDVTTEEMGQFVALAHTVFNAGLGISCDVNRDELRFFAPVSTWSERVAAQGFVDHGSRLAQPGDPTQNLLMLFTKQELAS